MRVLLAMLFVLLIAVQGEGDTGGGPSCKRPDIFETNVLAMTWQPGFCEHLPGNKDKPECRAMMSGKLTVDHLTLHGLWPSNRSCGTSYGHCPGKRMHLQPETITYIQPWMPNWYYSSSFGAYEWRKHGTCQTALDDDRYFRKAVDAVIIFNNSPAGQYLVENRGKWISKKVFLGKLNQAVGDKRAADNLTLLCRGDALYEIRLLLARNFVEGQGIGLMMQGALDEQAGKGRGTCRNDRLWIERSGRD